MNRNQIEPLPPRHRSFLSWIGALLFAATASGCTAGNRAAEGTVLVASLREIQPMADRDHHVYVWQRLIDGKRTSEGVQVEHVTALAEDEFEIAISEDGKPSGRLRVHVTDHVLEVIEEDDVPQAIRLSYSPPLQQLQAPVVVGEVTTSGTASIQSLNDDDELNVIDVRQTVRTRSTRRIESDLEDFDEGVAVRTRRTLITPSGAIELESAAILVPGVGEIRSESTASAVETSAEGSETSPKIITRRELACAIISGKAIGDCGKVPALIDKIRQKDG